VSNILRAVPTEDRRCLWIRYGSRDHNV